MEVLSLVTTPRPFYLEQVRALENQGVNCTTLTVGGRNSRTESRNLSDYIRYYFQVKREPKTQFDLVHANNGLTIPIALGQKVRPLIVTLWGSDIYGRYGRGVRHFSRLSDEVIVMSNPMAEDINHPVSVIPHGINLNKFQPMESTIAKRQVGWSTDKKHVLFPYLPSRPVKNHPLAKRVVQEVSDKTSVPIALQIINDVDHEDFSVYLNAADALLLTSTREGSPNSVKEAMACNLPVVATDVGDVAERLSGVTHSYVCTTEDELVERLIDVLEAGERSDGREHVQELSLERMGERIIEVYEEALS